MRGHVYDRVDIGLERRSSGLNEGSDSRTTHERDPSEVPEDNQEAPLFVVHIPRLGNAFFTLATEAGQ